MRYRVSYPVTDGYAWFGVYDSEENRDVITIAAEVPDAESVTVDLCAKLNWKLL